MRAPRRTIVSIAGFLLLNAVFIPGFASSAEAALVFCNRSQQPIEAAVGYRGAIDSGLEDWISEGWWRIEPGQCARVLNDALKERFYFDYAVAMTPQGHNTTPYSWSGKYQFCTDAKAFRVEGDGDCDARGYQTKGFQQIDIGPSTHDYTLDFKDNGQ